MTFKPDIDDLRESPALHIVQKLSRENLNIVAVEPNIELSTNPIKLGVNATKVKLNSLDECLAQADIFTLLVAHKEFKTANLPAVNLLDFCGVIQTR